MSEPTLAFLNVCYSPRLPASKAAPDGRPGRRVRALAECPADVMTAPGGFRPLVFNSAGLRATNGTALLRTSPPRSRRAGFALLPRLLQPLEQPLPWPRCFPKGSPGLQPAPLCRRPASLHLPSYSGYFLINFFSFFLAVLCGMWNP